LKRYRGECTENESYLIAVEGDGIFEISSKKPVQFKNNLISYTINKSKEHIYRVNGL